MSTIEIGYLFTGHKEIKVLSNGSTYEGWSRGANAANGIGVEHEIYNSGDKAIKYITFTYIPSNRVGDTISCQISGKSEVNCQLTGPFFPDEKSEVRWDCLWYNPTVSEVTIKEIRVQYMDDTEEIIPGAEVKHTSDKNSVYYEKHGKKQMEEYAKKKAIMEAEYAKKKAIMEAEYAKKKAEEVKKKEEEDRKNAEVQQNKTNLILAYLGPLVLIPLFTSKDSELVKFHTNQGLVLALIELIYGVLYLITSNNSSWGTLVGMIGCLAFIPLFLAIFFGIDSALKGEKKALPLIGKIKIIK